MHFMLVLHTYFQKELCILSYSLTVLFICLHCYNGYCFLCGMLSPLKISGLLSMIESMGRFVKV